MSVTGTQTSSLPSSGRLEITYPKTLKIEEGDSVSVEIITDPQFVQTGVFSPYVTGLVKIEFRNPDETRGFAEASIPIYPVMLAELQAENFKISKSPISAKRTIVYGQSALWVWSIVAQTPGEHRIAINIYGGQSLDKEADISIASIEPVISVSDKPFFDKAGNALSNNIVPVIVAILSTTGPLGIFLAYRTYKMNQEKQKLQDELGTLKKQRETEQKELLERIEKIEKQIAEEKQASASKISELKKIHDGEKQKLHSQISDLTNKLSKKQERLGQSEVSGNPTNDKPENALIEEFDVLSCLFWPNPEVQTPLDRTKNFEFGAEISYICSRETTPVITAFSLKLGDKLPNDNECLPEKVPTNLIFGRDRKNCPSGKNNHKGLFVYFDQPENFYLILQIVIFNSTSLNVLYCKHISYLGNWKK